MPGAVTFAGNSLIGFRTNKRSADFHLAGSALIIKKRRDLMKRKGLYFLIALALGGVSAVHAQDNTSTAASSSSSSSSDTSSTSAPAWPNGFDDRWYIAPYVGGYYNDTDRDTRSRQFFYGLGVGKFISSNVAIELFVDRTKRKGDSDVFGQGNTWRTTTTALPRATSSATGTPGVRICWAV
jgi:hypothetical protein